MPLYEYKCKKCGHRFERIQSFSDPPVRTCPVCGGRVEQLMSAPAVQFKGSGWYATDYAKRPATATTDTTAEGSGAAEVKPDSAGKKSEQKLEKTDSKGKAGERATPKPDRKGRSPR